MAADLDSVLDELVARLRPEVTIDLVEDRVNEAFATYPVDGSVVEDRYRCLCLLEDFAATLAHSIYPEIPKRFFLAEDRLTELLKHEYGRGHRSPEVHGKVVAWRLISQRVEGGLSTVLRAIARQMIRVTCGVKLASIVGRGLQGLSLWDEMQLSAVYLERFGHLMQPSGRGHRKYLDPHDFRRVLERHPYMLKGYRKYRGVGTRPVSERDHVLTSTGDGMVAEPDAQAEAIGYGS